jgi:hypothetical protein
MSELVQELRASRPVAPEALRAKVAELVSREPEPRRSWSLPQLRVRKLALVLVPACLALAVLGALGAAIARSPGGDSAALSTQPAELRAPATPEAQKTPVPRAVGTPLSGANAARAADSTVTQLPPAKGRYQDYTASMRIRLDDVDGMSSATQRAMRLARRLGGYVVSVRYGSEGSRKGEAYLTLRVPVGRVQTAVVSLSNLGTILGQNISIQDLQPQVNALERTIIRLKSDIAAIDAQLESGSLSAAERTKLEFRRQRLATQLRQATTARAATINRASFATVSLELTTHRQKEAAAAPGRFRSTIDDAGGILAAEAAWTLLVLAVALPFVLLVTLVFWGIRSARRYADRRLLET